jgi:hypothetical protein
VFVNVNIERDMERYDGIDFEKLRWNFGGGVSTSRKASFGGFMNTGDAIRYVTGAYMGKGTTYSVFTTLRPLTRLQSEINLNSSRFVDVRTNAEEFDIKILRTLTTYQFTDRFLLRNILEYNNYEKTLGANLLLTYRVNAGTAFYIGYDDRYREGHQINPELLPYSELRRTNRAIFSKLQFLFRY